MDSMIVTAANREPVRVRRNPSTSAETVGRLKCGTAVQAGEDVNGWREIVFGDSTAYIMSKFLRRADEPDNFVRTLSATEYSRLCGAKDQLESALRTLKHITGVD